MLQFNNNHIFTGYLKQFLSSFNLPTCRVYTAEFEKYYTEHGKEHPKVIESTPSIVLPTSVMGENGTIPAIGVTYLKDGSPQQYFWDTSNWNFNTNSAGNQTIKYWKNTRPIYYNGNKIFGLTKTLQNPTTLYNYQTHEYLGEYLRFLRDYEGIDLMSMYNCFSNRLCNNIKWSSSWQVQASDPNEPDKVVNKTITAVFNAYDSNYKIYMLPVKLFEKYTIALDSYQGVEMFCGFYNEIFDTENSEKADDLMQRTYQKVSKTLFNQPFIYDKLDVAHWTWEQDRDEMSNVDRLLRSKLATRENELKLFIKIPATNKSSIVILAGDYRNYNDTLYTFDSKKGWRYQANSTIANFETTNTYKKSELPELNNRSFRPISKLQLLALNTGASYPFSDRLMEYLIMNVILPNDPTPDNIVRIQRVMQDCGYDFQIEGIWEPKMQMILYDYLMNSGKFTVGFKTVLDKNGNPELDSLGKPIKEAPNRVINERTGNLQQAGQKMRSEFYDILGYGDKDAERLYASWRVETNEKTSRKQVVANNTLENVNIYDKLYLYDN